MDAFELLSSYDQNQVLGELTGIGSAELERFFREAHREAQSHLEEARRRAREERREITLDASRLSGVNRGDLWVVGPDGKARRELQKFPEAEAQLMNQTRPAEAVRPCPELGQARPLLARCAYNGLWSPSGTNWQPIRSVELSTSEVARLTDNPASGCGLLVLARRCYQSILGDIAGLCGLKQDSHAESIDLGIWLLAAEETAISHGWALDCRPVRAGMQAKLTEQLKELLTVRLPHLPASARTAVEDLLSSLAADDHYPACILTPLEGRPLPVDDCHPGGLLPSTFDRLVEARSTQRVACPGEDLDPKLLETLFGRARAFVPDEARAALYCPVFSWHQELPEGVGRAMHQGIQGPRGLMEQACLEQFRWYLRSIPDLSMDLLEWTALEGEALESRGKQLALPLRLVPAHLRSKLQEGGHYRRHGDWLLDRRQRPLTPARLMKLVRMMAKSFGNFFLSFQNTHPLLGIILARTGPADRGSVHQAVGRVAAHLTWLSRARAQVSIIKSGPLEIARGAIRRILAEKAPDGEIRALVGSSELEPVLTFQLGLPLGPDDVVSAGRPEEHDGLRERLLDRRAPRAPLSSHYLPALDQTRMLGS